MTLVTSDSKFCPSFREAQEASASKILHSFQFYWNLWRSLYQYKAPLSSKLPSPNLFFCPINKGKFNVDVVIFYGCPTAAVSRRRGVLYGLLPVDIDVPMSSLLSIIIIIDTMFVLWHCHDLTIAGAMLSNLIAVCLNDLNVLTMVDIDLACQNFVRDVIVERATRTNWISIIRVFLVRLWRPGFYPEAIQCRSYSPYHGLDLSRWQKSYTNRLPTIYDSIIVSSWYLYFQALFIGLVFTPEVTWFHPVYCPSRLLYLVCPIRKSFF